MKVLMNRDHWKPLPNGEPGPIFFYAGNEGPIELFVENTGFMFELAEEFGAMVVFAEHRYYGESLPFGKDAFEKPEQLQWLTSQQAIADFVELGKHIREWNKVPSAAIVLFGGSYGGMLAAWARMKHPHVFTGAISSSAPIFQFGDLTPSGAFNEVTTSVFKAASPACAANIRRSWDVLLQRSTTAEGRAATVAQLGLCAHPDISPLFDWLYAAYVYPAMANYPYPTEFLGSLPAWPVKAMCEFIKKDDLPDDELLTSLRGAVGVYYNYTGQAGACYNVTVAQPDTLQDHGGWDYQSCNEMVMPWSQDGVNDMFWPAPWNYTEFVVNCQKRFGITPRPSWVESYYGGPEALRTASNIVFSQGVLDPWYAGGPQENMTDASYIALMIEDAAHHLDLRSSHPDDPESVIAARNIERAAIRAWINGNEWPHLRPVIPPEPSLTRTNLGMICAGAGVAASIILYYLCNCLKRKPEDTDYVRVQQEAKINPA